MLYDQTDSSILNEAWSSVKKTQESQELSDSTIKLHYDNLKVSWRNETFAPELLPFENDTVDQLLSVLSRQKEYIEELSAESAEQPRASNISVPIYYEMEWERVRYLLKRYLRTRLDKIEKYSAFIALQDEELEKLSEEEKSYLLQYETMVQEYEQEAYLSQIPENNPKSKDFHTFAPFLFVPVNVMLPVGETPISILFPGSAEPIQIVSNVQTVVPYIHVRDYVLNKRLYLV